jgi:hypothetical protein
MRLKLLTIASAILASSFVASAHSPKPGGSGPLIADAGNYHVEVAASGTALVILLRDQADKPVSSEGHKGTAVFVIDGKAQRIPLAPAGDNKLTGTAPAAMPARPKGAVQITKPDGATVQAKF